MNLRPVARDDDEAVCRELLRTFARGLHTRGGNNKHKVQNSLQIGSHATDNTVKRIDDIQQTRAHLAIGCDGLLIRAGRQEKLRQILNRWHTE